MLLLVSLFFSKLTVAQRDGGLTPGQQGGPDYPSLSGVTFLVQAPGKKNLVRGWQLTPLPLSIVSSVDVNAPEKLTSPNDKCLLDLTAK